MGGISSVNPPKRVDGSDREKSARHVGLRRQDLILYCGGKMYNKTMPQWANVWGFFAATYAAAWLLWLPAILLRGEQPTLLLVVLGAFMPSVMGIVFTYLT